MRDTIVVGCGIIGATVAQALCKEGQDVLVLDDSRPNSGTAPSGGHLKPSWFGGMKKTDYEPAMKLLDDVWGLKEEEFAILAPVVGKITSTTVYRVDTDQVLLTPRKQGTVTEISQTHNFPRVVWDGGEERCRLLVVATGAWAHELLPGVQTKVKQGVSFRLKGRLDRPFIKPWAPYKQIVTHQQGPEEIWVGDGTAVYPDNWKPERTRSCRERCLGVVPGASVLREMVGWRPYCVVSGSDPCLLKQLGPRAWVATGAGKSGTIAAGWVARRILDASV